jgi:hypothetical protein
MVSWRIFIKNSLKSALLEQGFTQILIGYIDFWLQEMELTLITAHLKLIVLKVIGEFLFLFGLLAWVYRVLVQLIHPDYLSTSLSHLILWIRVDTLQS